MKIKLRLKNNKNNKNKKKRRKNKSESEKPEWLKAKEELTNRLNQNRLVKKEEDRDIVVNRGNDYSSTQKYSRKNIFNG